MTCVGRASFSVLFSHRRRYIADAPLSSLLFTLPTFRSPATTGGTDTPCSLPLINPPRTPRATLARLHPHRGAPVAPCANLVQSPTNLFVVELFSVREEKLGNTANAGIDEGSKNRDSSSRASRRVASHRAMPRRTASDDDSPMFIASIAFLYSTAITSTG